MRIEIARLLGWPENKVRVKVPYLGGGFGAKLYIKLEALVAALALIVQRPVKICAHDGGAVLHADQACRDVPHQERRRRTAASSRAHCEVCWNGGAYADIGPRITQKSGFTAPGPYDIDNVNDRFLRALHQPDRRPARCAASAFRSWCGPTRATPT